MHPEGRKRQRYSGEARQQRARTLKVYLSADDLAGLQRIAREMGITNSYAATLAIRQFRANAEADRRDRATRTSPRLAFREQSTEPPSDQAPSRR